MLFCDNDRNLGYGEHVWTLTADLPRPCDIDGLAEFACEFFDCDDGASIVDPDDIVDSAQAWDDPQFVSEVWQQFELVGVRTQDGAVVLDKESVSLEYNRDQDSY